MKTLQLCLIGATLNACVITYDFPQEEQQKAGQIPGISYYHIGRYQPTISLQLDPTYYMSAPKNETYAKLEQIMVDRGIPSITGDSPPAQGYYFTVTLFPTHPSFAAQQFWLLSLVTGFFLPSFSGTGGYLITYDLYADGEFQKTYHYEIGRNGMTWVALLPFMWVNLLTASEEDAFRATTTQFLLDAGRDQHWESS